MRDPRYNLIALLILAMGFFTISKAQAGPGEHDTEGQAWADCTADAQTADANSGYPGYYQYDCVTAGEQAITCRQTANGTAACQAPWTYYWDTNCADLPDGRAIFSSGPNFPAGACRDGCEFVDEGTGVGVCLSNSCLSSMNPSGAICSGGDTEQDAPDGCTIQAEVIVCDCVVNPGAPFCPGGSDSGDCTDNGDGTSSCNDVGAGGGGGAGDPCVAGDSNCYNAGGGVCQTGETCTVGGGGGDPGGPGDGTANPNDPAPPGGDPCSPGDPNCLDDTGGICDEGDVCTTGGGVGDGVSDTCDPAVENCEGEGTAGTAGSCANEPPCDGDAIQCAILIQSWKNTCLALDLGGAKPPWDGDADYGRDLADEATSVDISGGLDDAGFASGSCPASTQVSVMGAVFDIDFTPICDIAAVVRVFVILFSLMWAGPYVVRSFG